MKIILRRATNCLLDFIGERYEYYYYGGYYERYYSGEDELKKLVLVSSMTFIVLPMLYDYTFVGFIQPTGGMTDC